MRPLLGDPLPAEFHDAYQAPHCIASGNARAARFFPGGYSLWRIVGDLGRDAQLVWDKDHGDEALYLLSGMVKVDNTEVQAESAVIVEAGVTTRLRAVEDSRLIHFGPRSPEPPSEGILGPPQEHGRGVHVIPLESAERISRDEHAPDHPFFSDGTCRTCRISFFMSDFTAGCRPFNAPSHTHSEDDIIHVLEGVLQVGPLRVAAGMTIAVPKDVRYGFRADGPFRFLNYRRDIAMFTRAPGTQPSRETVAELRQLLTSVD